MSDMNLMRNLVAAVYTGDEWKNKVANMDDYQVTAVYLSFKKRGLIGKTVEYEPPKGVDRLTEILEDIPELDEILESRKFEQIVVPDLDEPKVYKPILEGRRIVNGWLRDYSCTACKKVFTRYDDNPGNYCPVCGVKLK